MSKKISVSSGNGKYLISDVASVDETSGEVTINKLEASSSVYISGTSGLLNQYAGAIENIDLDGATSGSVLWSNGGKFQLSEISLQALGGDLEGLLSNARVVSVENVVSGTLGVAAGGTGKTSLASGSLLALSQSNIPASSSAIVSVNSAGTQWVTTGSSILDVTPLTEPIVYLYTGSVGGDTVLPWTKPAGCRFVRVICQGGGACAGTFPASAYTPSGGGGGGGYSDCTFNGLYITDSVIVTAGKGSPGGYTYGSGGSSSFGNYLYAEGGNYGISGAGGIGGRGFTFTGGSGGAGSSTGATAASNIIGTAAGGGGAGYPGTAGGKGGNVTYSGVVVNGGAGGAASTNKTLNSGGSGSDFNYLRYKTIIINNTPSQTLPNLISGGGGGASWTGAGLSNNSIAGSSAFGSGAGGKSRTSQNYSGQTGNGGKGYVLIICW